MSRRILCRFHEDRTPSMYLYPDGGYCFVCQKRATLEELALPGGAPVEEQEPEDLAPALEYIDSLPLKPWRGLQVPMDGDSAYLVWPDRTYFKRRLLNNEKVRYLGPTGHSAPWFWVKDYGHALVVIEGEINALSVHTACPHLAVASPGASSKFSRKSAQNSLTKVCNFDTVLIVADADAAGAKAVIDLYGEIAGRVPTVRTLLMPTDANDLLVNRGADEVKRIIEGAVEGHLAQSP